MGKFDKNLDVEIKVIDNKAGDSNHTIKNIFLIFPLFSVRIPIFLTF